MTACILWFFFAGALKYSGTASFCVECSIFRREQEQSKVCQLSFLRLLQSESLNLCAICEVQSEGDQCLQ